MVALFNLDGRDSVVSKLSIYIDAMDYGVRANDSIRWQWVKVASADILQQEIQIFCDIAGGHADACAMRTECATLVVYCDGRKREAAGGGSDVYIAMDNVEWMLRR